MEVARQVAGVLIEEAQRQKRSLREVGDAAGHKNVLYKIRDGGDFTVSTLWALAEALGIPVSELAFRVESRRRVVTERSGR